NFVDSITIKGTTTADVVSIGATSVVINGLTLSYANTEAMTYIGQGGGDAVTISGGPKVSLPDESLGSVTINTGGSASLVAATAGGISARTINMLTVDAGGTLTVASPSNQSNRTVIVTSNLTLNG